MMSNILWADI